MQAAIDEAWATVPMALCVGAFIACWLAVDWIATRVTAFLWLQFEIGGDDSLCAYVTAAMQRASREAAPRAELGATEEGIDWDDQPKLFSLNHESTSVGASRFRPIKSKLSPHRWTTVDVADPESRQPGLVSVWVKDGKPSCPHCGGNCIRTGLPYCPMTQDFFEKEDLNKTSKVLHLWRWGPSWLPSTTPFDCRRQLVHFLQTERRKSLYVTPT